ncbi:hypothetical protein BDZ45DRAFT_736069 [Acephala macrosclerotiorum]|nr:hypothetical protein BDZ45DRAFT_736069 [Acephala macrosclerotiorum]
MPGLIQTDPSPPICPADAADISDAQNSVYMPPHDCEVCMDSFYESPKYRGNFSDIKAEDIASDYVRSAEADRHYLTKLLLSHGDIVLRSGQQQPLAYTGEAQNRRDEEWLVVLVDNPGFFETLKTPVTKQADQMLNLMFTGSAMKSNKGIEWNLFVHTMSGMGFSARNCGGSAVSFEKSNVKDGAPAGKAIFNEPHPGSKIDHTMLHYMGKRMTKWFGWFSER